MAQVLCFLCPGTQSKVDLPAEVLSPARARWRHVDATFGVRLFDTTSWYILLHSWATLLQEHIQKQHLFRSASNIIRLPAPRDLKQVVWCNRPFFLVLIQNAIGALHPFPVHQTTSIAGVHKGHIVAGENPEVLKDLAIGICAIEIVAWTSRRIYVYIYI